MKAISVNTFIFCFLGILVLSSCAGLKFIREDEPNNAGTKALDYSNGKIEIVDTYTCKIVAGNGKRVFSVQKSIDAAKKDVLLKCQDQTLISFCKPENVSCEKN